VSEDDWTLIMLSRHNDTDHPSMSGGLNFGTFDQPGSGDWRNCLDGDVRRLFSAFEFDSELLITPIGLLPFAMDTHKQQEYWYQYNEGLQVRYGSSLPDRDLEHFEISVDKVNFANFMTMVRGRAYTTLCFQLLRCRTPPLARAWLGPTVSAATC
jgi:hypothetical protein